MHGRQANEKGTCAPSVKGRAMPENESPPYNGEYFIFGHSPTLYRRGTSDLFIGLPAMYLLLTTHKWVLWVEHT